MEIQIQCSGYSIAADWLEGSASDNILVVLPGYSSSKARQRVHAEVMVEETGTSALVVDLSGHGNSPFDLDETRPAQHFLELIYVFDWVKEHHPDAMVSVSGSSYGGYLAVQLTKYREFANLVLRAPAIYMPSAFYTPWSHRTNNLEDYDASMQAYRRDKDLLAKHPLLARASEFEGRTLVVVHENDEQVPRETTDAYINAFSADTIIAQGFSHTIDAAVQDPETLLDYQKKIASWLNDG